MPVTSQGPQVASGCCTERYPGHDGAGNISCYNVTISYYLVNK